DRDLFAHVAHEDLARQAVRAVDPHGVRAADTVRARATEGETPVLIPFDLVQPVEHPVGRIQLDLVLPVVGLLVLRRVEPLDAECRLHSSTRAPWARTS